MWTFEIENVGKVGRAQISMAPLVLLVGRNNTGKSYIATAAWALANASSILVSDDARERRPKWFADFVSGDPKKVRAVEVSEGRVQELVDHFNGELRRSGPALLQDAFAYDGFGNSTLQIVPTKPLLPFRVRIGVPPEGEQGRRVLLSGSIVESDGKTTRNFRYPAGRNADRALADRLFVEAVYRAMLGFDNRRGALYIPAARTGLMLALRSIITRSFESDSPPTAGLPRPISDFLQNLTLPRYSTASNAAQRVAEWLEETVVHGAINVSDEETPSFSYVPENTSLSLPLHVTSSMITELAPFLLLLKSPFLPRQIIFEEPEAHLHLSAQRAIARALARLVNSGLKILVTSHSDTFIQQINNLMHLHEHPQRDALMKELGYDASDLVNPDLAKAYEFVEDGPSTSVREVSKTAEGFIVPTLNDTLINLAKETITLQDND